MLLAPPRVSIAPAVMLALGLALEVPDAFPPGITETGRKTRWVLPALAGVVALALGLSLAIADLQLGRSDDSSDPSDALVHIDAAERLAPWDFSVLTSRVNALTAKAMLSKDPGDSKAVMEPARQLRDSDPTTYFSWQVLANVEYRFGDGSSEQRESIARRYLIEANKRNPWATVVLIRLYELDKDNGDCEAASVWAEKLCALDMCPPKPCKPKP